MSFKIRTDASGNGQFTIDSTDVLSINTNTTVSLPTGTANGVAYLNGSKVLTSGSALTFDGTNLRTGGITFADTSTQSTGGYTGFRNRIINGAMGIWQRGTSFTVAANTFTYTADRMNVVSGNSSTTVSRSTNVPTGVSQYSLQLQRTAGNTGTSSIVAAQVIESVNCYDLSGQTVTISFYAKAGANYSGGQLATTLWTGTAADQGITSIFGSWTGSAYTLANQTLTTTWTRFSFQATVPASTLEAGIVLSWTGSGTAGADDSVYITGVQLEKGSVATPFEFRPYGQELALCQRYCQAYRAINAYDVVASLIGYAYAGTFGGGSFQFLQQMRAAPTMTKNGNWRVLNYANGYPITNWVIDSTRTSTTGCEWNWTGASSSLTTGAAYYLQANNDTSAYFILSAEL